MERVVFGTELELLSNCANRNREGLIESVSRLSDAESRRALVPSATTPIGLIKHAAAAERFWFQRFLDGRTEDDCDGISSPGEGSFRVAAHETLAEVIAEFRAASQTSREILNRFSLDDVLHNSHGEPVSVRFVLIHAIEEFARHAGHADILVEQILDGR